MTTETSGTHWSKLTIESAREVQDVDVLIAKLPDGHGGFIKTLPAIAVTGDEYFVLRRHRRVLDQKDEDGKNQMIGLLLTFQRMHKADRGFSEAAFFTLPLEKQLALVRALDDHFGMSDIGPAGPTKN